MNSARATSVNKGNRTGIRAAYGTGRGKITLRSRVHFEDGKNDRTRIVVTEIPYMVNKANLVESIADCHKDKRIEGITALRDETGHAALPLGLGWTVGTQLRLEGRLQSRSYIKLTEEGALQRVAFEVSVAEAVSEEAGSTP